MNRGGLPGRGTPLDVANRTRALIGGRPGSVSGGYDAGPAVPYQAPGPGLGLVLPPWTVDKPPNATDYRDDGFVLGLTAAAGETVLASFQVPDSNVAVIRSLALSANGITTTTVLQFRLRENQNPVEGWAPITLFPRNASTITEAYGPDETYHVFPEGALIDVTALVVDPGTYDAGAAFHGWFVDVNVHEALRDAYESAGS